MTGVRFADWEIFLRYVGSQEKMSHREEWRKAADLWDMDCLEPGEWKDMEKILFPSNYEEVEKCMGTVEIRSFRLPCESDGMIFYAAGKEEGGGVISAWSMGLWKKKKQKVLKAVMSLSLSRWKRERPGFIGLEQSRSIGAVTQNCQKWFQVKYWRRCF